MKRKVCVTQLPSPQVIGYLRVSTVDQDREGGAELSTLNWVRFHKYTVEYISDKSYYVL